MLLEHILFNELHLEVEPWDAKEESIAVNACIDALPLAKDSARNTLTELVLRVCGGGAVELPGTFRGTRIEVTQTKNGRSMRQSGVLYPPSLEAAQDELRRLYIKSKEEVPAPPKQ